MKQDLRKLMLSKRREMTPVEAGAKSKEAAEKFLESDLFKNAAQIMLYKTLGNETDTALIAEEACRKGKKVVLPVTNGETGEITAYLVNSDTRYKKGAFSVDEPQNCEPADVNLTDVIIVPGVAFDRYGNRIGFGKGCYDMFLNGVKAVKVGFCYEFQVLEKIPGEQHDIKMDYIFTEKGMYLCRMK